MVIHVYMIVIYMTTWGIVIQMHHHMHVNFFLQTYVILVIGLKLERFFIM